MGAFVKGDVVVTPFPFSDLRAAKKRPALVVATLAGNDVIILCQITSQAVADSCYDATGTVKKNVEPRPSSLLTQMRSPCASIA